jgi:hypothetical protein
VHLLDIVVGKFVALPVGLGALGPGTAAHGNVGNDWVVEPARGAMNGQIINWH